VRYNEKGVFSVRPHKGRRQSLALLGWAKVQKTLHRAGDSQFRVLPRDFSLLGETSSNLLCRMERSMI
jgi:hypothetical protein